MAARTSKGGVIDLTLDDDDDDDDDEVASAPRRGVAHQQQRKRRAPDGVEEEEEDLAGEEEEEEDEGQVLISARLTTTTDMSKRPRVVPPPASKPLAAAREPAWARRRGIPRIVLEFKSIRDEWGDEKPRVFDLQFFEDRATTWRFKVNDFDATSPGGRQLNADLAELSRRRGQNFIEMEIQFPLVAGGNHRQGSSSSSTDSSYPHEPFFLRCVSPRFVWYSGHVTAGGAICIEALTSSGTPGSWSPSHCVESILRTVFANMVFAEIGYVRTANGPGGKTGPLRVDLSHRFATDVLRPYSEHEARAAFSRMLHHHRQHGW